MSALPPEVVDSIEAREGINSDHADSDFLRLGLEWADIIELARTASTWKRTRDEKGDSEYVDAVTGRDTHGRLLYMAGKIIAYENQKHWYVITVHEAR